MKEHLTFFSKMFKLKSRMHSHSTGANSHRRPNKEIRSTYLTEKV